jgi:hypothetical protein
MDGPLWTISFSTSLEAPMPTMFFLPWRWTRAPRPEHAVIFASRFDAAGMRPGSLLFVGGLRLRRAVLRAPGALGVTLRAHPLRGRYYSLSLWRDADSLLAFAHSPAHQDIVHRITELGPIQGLLISRDTEPAARPTWRDTMRWLATIEPGPYGHQAGNPPLAEHSATTVREWS